MSLTKFLPRKGISDWLTAGHWQYLTWYISLGLSLAGGFAICISATYLNRPIKYSLDKGVGVLCILPVIASLITASIFDSPEPWTDGLVKLEKHGLLSSSCSMLDSTRDKFYPLLYQRCMLSDATWILAIIICINWVVLVGFVMLVTRKEGSSAVVDKNSIRPAVAPLQEPKWGRYIPDPPSSIYSATTLGNRSGLLTPSSTLTKSKHKEFYASCSYSESIPSIPSSPYKEYTMDYLYKTEPVMSRPSDFFSSENYEKYSTKSLSGQQGYGDRSSNISSSLYHYSSGNKGGDDWDEEEEDRTSTLNSKKLLRISTTYRGSSPPHSLSDKKPEPATTPLYSKFSRKTAAFDIGFSSDKNSSSSYY